MRTLVLFSSRHKWISLSQFKLGFPKLRLRKFSTVPARNGISVYSPCSDNGRTFAALNGIVLPSRNLTDKTATLRYSARLEATQIISTTCFRQFRAGSSGFQTGPYGCEKGVSAGWVSCSPEPAKATVDKDKVNTAIAYFFTRYFLFIPRYLWTCDGESRQRIRRFDDH